MEIDKKISCTILAILYVVAAYLCPFIWMGLFTYDDTTNISFVALGIPFIMGIFNAVYIKSNFEKISRNTLLRCAILIKYLLIPMYIVGGFLIVVFLLITVIPIVITIFIGPFFVLLLSAYGYATMLGGNAFSLAYIKKARREGVHGKLLSRIGKILQFFFTIDVISLAVLSIKEKKYIGATVAVIIALILGFISIIAWLILQ